MTTITSRAFGDVKKITMLWLQLVVDVVRLQTTMFIGVLCVQGKGVKRARLLNNRQQVVAKSRCVDTSLALPP